MRADAFRENEARRAAEQRAGSTRSAPVQVPGLAGMETPASHQTRVDRAAALAKLEREITAKRVEVTQLRLVLEDWSIPAFERDKYRPLLDARDAELRQLEARASRLTRDSPAACSL